MVVQGVASRLSSSRMVLTVRILVCLTLKPFQCSPQPIIDKLTAKAQKITIKLPWEIMNMFSDVLPTDDEEDEDDIEAHEASIQRLKVCHHLTFQCYTPEHAALQEADDATRQMTREEYQHYSDCRQASFTYRKGTSPRRLLPAL